ncbi:MAG: hypothetical protein ACE5DK_03675 [Paracoccaceae bacterium]
MTRTASTVPAASSAITSYRWIVFLLALGFWLYQFLFADMGAFGIQFRYLTIWGLTANLVVAGMMLRLSLGRSERSYNAFVSATAVLGAIVVFMYWKLYFTDPALVNGGNALPWYQEYYLHAGTQVLMWIDAFFILGVFDAIWKTLLTMLAIFLGYIAWIEILVRPLNDAPVGSATSGLPYPFLNDMAMGDRAGFYATTIASAVIFQGIGWVISRIIRRAR